MTNPTKKAEPSALERASALLIALRDDGMSIEVRPNTINWPEIKLVDLIRDLINEYPGGVEADLLAARKSLQEKTKALLAGAALTEARYLATEIYNDPLIHMKPHKAEGIAAALEKLVDYTEKAEADTAAAQRNAEWLAHNAVMYAGQWVVLRAGVLVGADPLEEALLHRLGDGARVYRIAQVMP